MLELWLFSDSDRGGGKGGGASSVAAAPFSPLSEYLIVEVIGVLRQFYVEGKHIVIWKRHADNL